MGYHPPGSKKHCRMAVFRREFLRGKKAITIQVGESAINVPVMPDDTPTKFVSRFIELWEEYPREPNLKQKGAMVYVTGKLVRHILIKGK